MVMYSIMSITFSTCFYAIKSKFHADQYVQWMSNFISIVHSFYLVIYTDEHSLQYIPDVSSNPNIQVVLRPMDQLYNYKYKSFWIENHARNHLLKDKSSWELNMLWAEKIHFVKDTIERKYFDTEWYGWCDIGYFRNREADTHITQLQQWPNPAVLLSLDPTKIVYGCVNNNDQSMQQLIQQIQTKNKDGLPTHPLPPNQVSISGGFFLLHKQKIDWWFHTFDCQLFKYFLHQYLVKDDQIVLADCIFSNIDHFSLYREYNFQYDNWFMFQRILNQGNI